jgi:DNA polymerase bacteriophage-type
MPNVFWDFETRSAVSLREAGAHIYATDSSTEVLFFCYAVDDGEVQTWHRGDPPAATPFPAVADNPSVWKVVSDNWTFERCIYESILIPRFGFPPLPLEVHDCAERLALANSFPAELGLRAQALGLPYRKDTAARRAMLAISRPMKPRGKKKQTTLQWDEDPAKYAQVLERCKLDVITTRACWNAPQLKHLSETERGYLLLDARINDRGVRADVEFVHAARELAVRERIAINLRLQELTNGTITSVDQVQRVMEAVNNHGHRMTTINKRAVAAVLAGKPDDFVRELLTLRRNGAHASVKKYQRALAYAAAADQRMRGTLRIYGAGPGRWSGVGPQLQNLRRNDCNLPLELIEAVRRGDREALARYGNPLSLLGDLSRAMLCAALGNVLISGDLGQIESRILAWLAGEQWKLDSYAQFDATGDKSIEVYRVVAHRMLQKNTPVSAITQAERQIGKAADLAAGFGGGPGAWRRIVEHETRTDDEIKLIIRQWREAHPAICRFWKELARAIRIAIRSGQPILVAPAPRPPIVAAFAGGNLTLTLPSGRAITYPQARLVPGKYEDGDPDVQFMDNARGQWKPYRGWFGTFIENTVQGCARDLLAAAIARFEARGIPVVFHCHDEVTCEVFAGSITEVEFLGILLEAPPWAAGLPLGGKVHSGSHYLEPPETPAEPLAPNSDAELVEIAVDEYLEETRDAEITDPVTLERADEEDYVAALENHVAPLTELVTLPLTPSNHVACPFHADPNPSCSIYPDHFFCHGCGEHGGRLDWLIRAEGMTHAEAMLAIHDWTAPARRAPQNGGDRTDTYAFAMGLWTGAGELRGTVAERYLAETRGIDVTRLPADVHDSLRFHPRCVFGSGTRLPCLLALMRDPLTDAPVGIQRTALTVVNGQVRKVDRKMLGHTGVVKLWTATDKLVIGEGLETVLGGATRIPYEGAPLTPAWAALSDSNMAKLPVLPGVSTLILLVDNDGNQMGQHAAEHAQRRWVAAGRTVIPLIPNTVGKDFNDLVLEGDFDA